MLTAVLGIFLSGTPPQGVFAVVLALLYIKIYAYYHPYLVGDNNTLMEIGQFLIFFTFFAALIIQNELLGPSMNEIVGGVLVFCNICFVMFAIGYVGYKVLFPPQDGTSDAFPSIINKADDSVEGGLSKGAGAGDIEMKFIPGNSAGEYASSTGEVHNIVHNPLMDGTAARFTSDGCDSASMNAIDDCDRVDENINEMSVATTSTNPSRLVDEAVGLDLVLEENDDGDFN